MFYPVTNEPIEETAAATPEINVAEPTPTTIVRVKPEQDTEVQSFYQEAIRLQEYATARVITTAEDLKPATDDLSSIAKVKKALEEKRKEYLSPFRNHIEEISDAFKRLMEPILAADSITRDKMLAFDAEQKRIRREQEEINRKRKEAADAEMALKGELTESVDLVEVASEIPTTIRTDMGMVGQRMIRKYRVVDFALLPDQYKIENSALLNKVVKAGIPEIAGVEIWSEPIIAVNVR